MRIKSFSLLTFLSCSVLSVVMATTNMMPASAFDGGDCKKGTLYYNYHHASAEDKKKMQTPKAKSDVKTIADCNLPKEDHDLMDKSTVIINVIVSIVGIISVAVIVIGGITFATSQGDTAKTTKAKNTILYGIVGLIIALLAFAIVNFVLKSVF